MAKGNGSAETLIEREVQDVFLAHFRALQSKTGEWWEQSPGSHLLNGLQARLAFLRDDWQDGERGLAVEAVESCVKHLPRFGEEEAKKAGEVFERELESWHRQEGESLSEGRFPNDAHAAKHLSRLRGFLDAAKQVALAQACRKIDLARARDAAKAEAVEDDADRERIGYKERKPNSEAEEKKDWPDPSKHTGNPGDGYRNDP